MDGNRVASFASSERRYQSAFEIFLRCTDQKLKAMHFLDEHVAKLSKRDVFIDVGAGTGALTAHLAKEFRVSTAIEPNQSLVSELRMSCPGVTVLPVGVESATVECKADFILCSHVLYYIPRESWVPNLERMSNWLHADGILAVALQNPETDCMKMVCRFTGGRFELRAACEDFAARNRQFTTLIITVPATIRTSCIDEACAIAEFVLNVLPMPSPPRMDEVRSYVQKNFCRRDHFEFSCDQDFLLISACAPA